MIRKKDSLHQVGKVFIAVILTLFILSSILVNANAANEAGDKKQKQVLNVKIPDGEK
jgi:Na+/alanine symporter